MASALCLAALTSEPQTSPNEKSCLVSICENEFEFLYTMNIALLSSVSKGISLIYLLSEMANIFLFVLIMVRRRGSGHDSLGRSEHNGLLRFNTGEMHRMSSRNIIA